MNEPLRKLRQILKENRLDALLISSISNITYLTNYSGFSKEEREAYLFIVAQPQGLTHKTPGVLEYIITDGRYSEAVKKQIKSFKLIEISSKISTMDALKDLTKKQKIKKIGFEGHNITHLEHKRLSKIFKNIVHLNLTSLRNIKSSKEISAIEKACQLGDKTFDYILKKIGVGVSEKEIAFEIEFFIKKHGADISFRPIVAFGKNSAIPHHQTSDQRLTTKDKFVLLDFGVRLNNYCSDMTRTVFFGKPTNEQKKIHQTVLTAQQKSIDILNTYYLIHNTINASKVDKVARDYITSKGYKTIPHSVGHGIGIEVHETPHISPKSKDILKEGMVFSIEPGIYIPNFGGVRIEDLVVLQKGKINLLTNSSRQLIIL